MGYHTYVKEGTTPEELLVYGQVIAPLATEYNEKFALLELPRAVEIDRSRRRLTLSNDAGETFNEKWTESDGGRLLGLDLAEDMAAIVSDLALIDGSQVRGLIARAKLGQVIFSHDRSTKRSTEILNALRDLGALTEPQRDEAGRLLEARYTTPIIFNNGDFYPRNLIRSPEGRVVVIDWEPFGPHSPFHLVDHPESVAAVPLVHMWSNTKWQAVYLGELDRRFGFEGAALRRGILIQALELANLWLNHGVQSPLVAPQVQTVKRALKVPVVKWGDG